MLLILCSGVLCLGCAFIAGKPSKSETVDFSADFSTSHLLFGLGLKNESVADELEVLSTTNVVSASTNVVN